jgi:predicted nuclease of predicted toxin-antitoxin system
MRFLVDECVGPSVVRWLRENNHDATSVYEDCRGWEDESILEKAYSESRIVVTIDKDFGEMVFRRKLPHCGVILLRSGFAGAAKKISMMQKVLTLPEKDISGHFIVVTETAIRISGMINTLD